jgi:TolB protein
MTTYRILGAMSVVVAAVLVAVFLLVLGGMRPADAAFPGNNGKIAFSATNNSDIYSINPDGTDLSQLTNAPEFDTEAAYSPEGERLAFTSYQSGGSEVWLMGAGGDNPRQLTNTESSISYSAAFSPDGSRIAFTRHDIPGDAEIWIMNADGSGQRPLTNNLQADDSYPTWSPNGERVAFASDRDAELNYEIFVMDAQDADGDGNGDNITRLTNTQDTSNTSPNWSSSGNKIAFESDREYEHDFHLHINYEVYSMDPTDANSDGEGDNMARLTTNENGLDSLSPAFSPDGQKIAFTRFNLFAGTMGTSQIFVMNKNGSQRTRIPNTPKNSGNPDWQPVPQCTKSGTPGDDAGANAIVGTSGKDVLCGLGGDDQISGLGGDDIILGGEDDDDLVGGPGNDVLVGGSGADTASFPGSKAVKASLATGFARGKGLDSLVQVENLSGSSSGDRLTGPLGFSPNQLVGRGGDDTLDSRDGVSGNDSVDGGSGTDTCKTDATEQTIVSCEL